MTYYKKSRQRGRNSRKEPKPKSGHKISVKRRGSATGACARSRSFNYVVLPQVKEEKTMQVLENERFRVEINEFGA
ncbi:MAG: hypothetical protein PUF64_08960, partial [Butyricicoccus sp.]|nr:hypothetical protein [Butyricicoccus sp.]